MCDWTNTNPGEGGDFPSLSLVNTLCDNCDQMKEELKKVQGEQTTNFLALKEKIISTDLLIKKYTAKCQDYDSQKKKLEETTEKYSQLECTCESLESQLKEALQEKEPLKKIKIRLEDKNAKLDAENRKLEDQIEATKSMNRQYEAARQTIEQERSQFKNQKLSLLEENKQLKISVKRGEEMLKKTKDQLKKVKDDEQDKQGDIRKLQTKVTKLESRIADYVSVLKIHGLLTDSGHLKPNARMTATAASKSSAEDMQVGGTEFPGDALLKVSMNKGAAPKAASAKMQNKYAQGRFQSAGFLTLTSGEEIKPKLDVAPPQQQLLDLSGKDQVTEDQCKASAKDNKPLHNKSLVSNELDVAESDTSEDETGQEVSDSDIDYIEQLVTQLSDAESEDANYRHRLHKPPSAVLSPLPLSPFVKTNKFHSAEDESTLSAESDTECAELIDAQLESPPTGRRGKSKSPSMKSPLTSEEQTPPLETSDSFSEDWKSDSEQLSAQSNARRSPRLAAVRTRSTSPVKCQPQSKKNDDFNMEIAQTSVEDKGGKKGKQTISVENDLELSSSESEAETVRSATSRRSPRNSQTMRQGSLQSLDSPRRSRRSSACSDSSESSGISPGIDHVVRLTRSRRLSESSSDGNSSPKVERVSRKARKRKESESSDSDTNQDLATRKRVTRSSKKDSIDSDRSKNKDCGSAITKSNSLPSSPKKADAAEQKVEFKEPLPYSPRTRRKTRSESIESMCAEADLQSIDKRVTRSISCPGGLTSNEGVITRRRSVSPDKGSNKVEKTVTRVTQENVVVSPKYRTKRDKLTKQEATDSGCKTKEENKLPADQKEPTEEETSVSCNETKDIETPTRLTRSQSKTSPSSEQGEIDQKFRTTRSRKRSKGQCLEGDEQASMLKIRSKFDSDTDQTTDTKRKVSNSPTTSGGNRGSDTDELNRSDQVASEDNAVKIRRATRSSSKVLTRQMSVHDDNASGEKATANEPTEEAKDKQVTDKDEKSERKIVHPEDRQIDRVGSLGFLYQKTSVDKVDTATVSNENQAEQPMLTPIINGVDGNKQPPLKRSSPTDKRFQSEESMDLDNFLLGDTSAGATVAGSSKYSDLHHHALSLDDVEELNEENVSLSETSVSIVQSWRSSSSSGLVRDDSLEGAGSSLLSKELSDRISPLSFASDQSRPISPLSISDTESLAPMLSPLPPTPEMSYDFDELEQDLCDDQNTNLSSGTHDCLDTPPLPEYANPSEAGSAMPMNKGIETDSIDTLFKAIQKIGDSNAHGKNTSELHQDGSKNNNDIDPGVPKSVEETHSTLPQPLKFELKKDNNSSGNVENTEDSDLNIPGAFIKLGKIIKKRHTKPSLPTKPKRLDKPQGAGNKLSSVVSKTNTIKKVCEKMKPKMKPNLQKLRQKGANIDDINIVPCRQHSHNPVSTRSRKPSSNVIIEKSKIDEILKGAKQIGASQKTESTQNQAADNQMPHPVAPIDRNSGPQELGPLKQRKRVSRVQSLERNTPSVTNPKQVKIESKNTQMTSQMKEETDNDLQLLELPKGKTSNQFKRRTSKFASSRRVKSTDDCNSEQGTVPKSTEGKTLQNTLTRKRSKSSSSVTADVEPERKKSLIEQSTTSDEKIAKQTIAAENKISNEVQLLVKFRSTMEKNVCTKLQGIPGATPPRIVNVILQLLKNLQTDLVQLLFSYCRHPISSDQWVPCMADHELKLMNLLQQLDMSMAGISELFIKDGTKLLLEKRENRSTSVTALSGICRVIVGLLRQQNLPVQAKVLVYNFVHENATGCPVLILATAAVWPHPIFADKFRDDPVLAVIEFLVMKDMLHNKTKNTKVSQCLSSLLSWKVPDTDSTKFTQSLLDKLSKAKESNDLVASTSRALELLLSHETWSWINDTFIIELVGPYLKTFLTSPFASNVPPLFMQSLLKLLALATSKCPLEHKAAAAGVVPWLTAFVAEPHCKNVALTVQVSAIEALLKLAPFGPVQVATVCRQWLQSHQKDISVDIKEVIATFLETYKSQIESQTADSL